MRRQQALATHMRPIVGCGLAFAVNAAPLLITELSYPTQVRTSALADVWNNY